MKSDANSHSLHLGRKIEQIRRLRGMTQTDLGMMLGISKQAVSKMEQKHSLNDTRLKRVAAALNVTDEGIRHFSESTILPQVNHVPQEAVPPGISSPSGFSKPAAAPTAAALRTSSMLLRTLQLYEELIRMERERMKN